jgi:hypothetical protein
MEGGERGGGRFEKFGHKNAIGKTRKRGPLQFMRTPSIPSIELSKNIGSRLVEIIYNLTILRTNNLFNIFTSVI